MQTLAPFLKFDADPYPVIVDGRIEWVLDGYTTTNNYPYSQSIHPQEPAGSGLDTDFNYVRNSVKATVDAYDGTVHFYVVDPTDPIIQDVPQGVPRAVHRTSSTMPAELRAHLRYPEDIFSAQTEQFALYHITDPVQSSTSRRSGTSRRAPTRRVPRRSPSAVAAGNNGGRNTTLLPSGSPIDPLYLTLGLPKAPGADAVAAGVRARTLVRAAPQGRHLVGVRGRAIRRRATTASSCVYDVPDTAAPSPGQAATLIQSDQFISSEFTLLGQRGLTGHPGRRAAASRSATRSCTSGRSWILGEGNTTFPRYEFVAAAVGQHAVLGCDMTDAVTALANNAPTRLQASQNRTNPCNGSHSHHDAHHRRHRNLDHDHDAGRTAGDRAAVDRICDAAPPGRAEPSSTPRTPPSRPESSANTRRTSRNARADVAAGATPSCTRGDDDHGAGCELDDGAQGDHHDGCALNRGRQPEARPARGSDVPARLVRPVRIVTMAVV